MAETTNEVKKLTSFKELQIEGPELQLDLEEDAWSYGAPPPAGVYEVKWVAEKEGFSVGYGKEGDLSTLYTRIAMSGKIVNNAEWEDSYVPCYLDSRVYKGKKNSTIAGFLVKAVGVDQLNKHRPFTPGKLAKLVEGLLKKEPVVKIELDWKGSYKTTDKNGKDVWENPYRHYKDFPEDGEGGKQHMFNITDKQGGTQEIRAQVQVARFLGKNETGVNQVTAKSPATTVAPLLVVDETPVVKIATPPAVKAPVPAPVVIATPVEDDANMELLLAD